MGEEGNDSVFCHDDSLQDFDTIDNGLGHEKASST